MTRPRLVPSPKIDNRSDDELFRRASTIISTQDARCHIEFIYSLSPRGFDATAKPVGFIDEADGAADLFERSVAFEDVEADAPLQLAQAHRTEMQRPAIAFGQVI